MEYKSVCLCCVIWTSISWGQNIFTICVFQPLYFSREHSIRLVWGLKRKGFHCCFVAYHHHKHNLNHNRKKEKDRKRNAVWFALFSISRTIYCVHRSLFDEGETIFDHETRWLNVEIVRNTQKHWNQITLSKMLNSFLRDIGHTMYALVRIVDDR